MPAISPEAFTPPSKPVPILELRLPAHAAGPLVVHSHGFTYTVTGNTLLARNKVEAIVLAAATPQDAVSQLNAAYLDAGFQLVALRAEVQGQSVRLAVVQGQITKIDAPSSVRTFYEGIEFDSTLTSDQLIRRNILAEAYAARSGLGLKPGLGPAPQPGGSELRVDATAQPGFRPVSGSVVLGNYGSRYVGGAVLGENLTVHPGRGLEFNLGYVHGLPNLLKDSAGSRYDAATAGASIVTPWGFYGLNYGRTSYRVGRAAAPLYPTGETQTWGLTGSQLVFASPTLRLSTTQGLTHVWNSTTVFNGLYTLTDQNYNYASLGLQASKNVGIGGQAGVVNAGVNYNLGLTGLRGTLSKQQPGAPVSHFHYWTLNANWLQSLPSGYSANLIANGQWGLDTLPQNQQWVLGGYGSLAAWTPGVLAGDGGYLVRAVLQSPNWYWAGWQVNAQTFAEQGAVTNHYTPTGTAGWQMLADVGVGLTFTAPWKTSLSLQAARPLSNKNVTASTLRSQRAVYLILQQPF